MEPAAATTRAMPLALRNRSRDWIHPPLECEPLPNRERPPTGVHLIELRFERGGGSALPGEVVSVDDALDRHQCRVVGPDDRTPRLRRPPPRNARKPPAVSQETPESVTDPERSLNRELRQVVWRLASGCHRRALNRPTVGRRGDPAAQAAHVSLVELNVHQHRFHPACMCETEPSMRPNGSRLSCGAMKKDSFRNLRAQPASSAC